MIGAAIPSRFHFDMLNGLLNELEGIETLVMDNGYSSAEYRQLRDRVETVRCNNLGIYEMWNLAWMWAAGKGIDHLAILNDDVSLGLDTLATMSNALNGSDFWVVSPDPEASGSSSGAPPRQVAGTYKDGGILGYCFMMDVSKYSVPPFDERYEWFGGDDQFVKDTIERGGKVARIDGLGVKHKGGASSQLRVDIADMVERDKERMRKAGTWN